MKLARQFGFTLIELLTVIAIIAILMGLLLPVLSTAKNAARKAQAKNDLTQLVAAVKAFYSDYGVYPIDPSVSGGGYADAEYGDYGSGMSPGMRHNSDVVNVLRADANSNDFLTGGKLTPLAINTRAQVYLDVPFVKSLTNPKSGLGTGAETSPLNTSHISGNWYDPWGGTYMVVIDANYDGYTIPYTLEYYKDIGYITDPTGAQSLQTGCIGGSYGADHTAGSNGNYVFLGSDDVLSWQ